MATQNKTAETGVQPADFIHSFVENEQKKEDAFRLMELMQQWSGHEPRMWGPSIIGFGSYHYQYASGHQGDAPLIGFSPRKAAFSIYVTVPGEENAQLLQQLGKYKMGKACIYFKKLSDLNLDVLQKLCAATLAFLQTRYGSRA